MPLIKVLPHPEASPEGATFNVEAGTTLCQALLQHDVHIEHACDMVCACTTCHVLVREGLASLPAAEDKEEDMLDRAWGLAPNSRLSCQIVVGSAPLTIEIPRYSINHAKEG